MLHELARRARLDDPAAHPGLEAHPLTVHVGARVVEDREDLGVAAKLHPDLLEKPVGVALDEVEALLVENPEWTELAEDAGRTRDHGAPADTRGPPASSASSCRRGFPRLNRHARRSRILQAVPAVTKASNDHPSTPARTPCHVPAGRASRNWPGSRRRRFRCRLSKVARPTNAASRSGYGPAPARRPAIPCLGSSIAAKRSDAVRDPRTAPGASPASP